MKTVADYMTQNALSISPQTTLFDAVMLMRQKQISSLLIREGEDNIGIFTERDLLNRVKFEDPDSMRVIKIREVMTTGLKTVKHEESYTDVIELMQQHGVRHMPVVKDGVIIGIVSLRDLLNHYYENLEHLLEETVAALSSAVEKRDPYTAGHQQRVTQLACAMAGELGFSAKQVSGVTMASVIHDVGKMYVPSEILTKPGRLSDAEMTLIRIHPQVGFDILKQIEFPWPVAQIVLQHHERLDGSGYPGALKGNDILSEAKVIAVADVVEAMASHRPYRPALGIDVALREIEQKRGVLYDEAAVDVCCSLFREKGFKFQQT